MPQKAFWERGMLATQHLHICKQVACHHRLSPQIKNCKQEEA